MKKLTAFVITFAAVTLLTACASKTTPSTEEGTAPAMEEKAEGTVTAPATEAPVMEEKAAQ